MMDTPQVLALNVEGVPMAWRTWQDAVCDKAKGHVVWEMGEFDWTKFGGHNRISGLRTTVKISSIMAIRGTYFPRRTTPPLTGPNLFGRDLYICGYCGGEFAHKQLTNDHIIPRSRGGVHSWMNCVTACKRCNNQKDNYLLEEVGMSLLYVPYVPSREEALLLHGKYILGDQMEFLKGTLPSHSRLLRMTIH